MSEKRLVWWLSDRRRGVRLDLNAHQVDMLALNALLDAAGRENIKATIKLHDKNHEMSVCRASTSPEIRSLAPVFSAAVAK